MFGGEACSRWRPSAREAYRERELDKTIFTALADVLFPAAEVVDVRGWGESLFAPDINDVIRLVAAHQARCRVVTNLPVNRPDTLDLLIDNGAMVDVSLDSAEQEVLDVCRPGGEAALDHAQPGEHGASAGQATSMVSGLRIIATLQS
jgi:MoaA/NifB/PqqE/SkfB family radical SAM enzyme